jgi:DNA-directed RNA polymerase subunit RPC12/RpoP
MTGTMLIYKCDKCGAEIEGTSLQIGFDIAYGIALCEPCAQPVIHFLMQSQLLQERLERHGFSKSTV